MSRRVRSPLTNSNSRRHKTASDLHELWRAGRRRPEGGYEPRKKVIDGRTYDIANLSYSALPKQVRLPALRAAHRSHWRTSTAARHVTHTHSSSLSCSRLRALSLSLTRSLALSRTHFLSRCVAPTPHGHSFGSQTSQPRAARAGTSNARTPRARRWSRRVAFSHALRGTSTSSGLPQTKSGQTHHS